MPHYEYKCVCGRIFTLLNIPMKDSDKQGKCPKCGEQADRKFSLIWNIIK